MSYFFSATLPLKPATIALKIGHLALQVDLIYQLAKQHDLRRVILATTKMAHPVLRGALFCCIVLPLYNLRQWIYHWTGSSTKLPTTTSSGTLHVDSTDRTKTCKKSKQQLAELPDFLEKFTTKNIGCLRIYIISISLYICYIYIYICVYIVSLFNNHDFMYHIIILYVYIHIHV